MKAIQKQLAESPAPGPDRRALGEALARVLVADLRRDPPATKKVSVKLSVVKR